MCPFRRATLYKEFRYPFQVKACSRGFHLSWGKEKEIHNLPTHLHLDTMIQALVRGTRRTTATVSLGTRWSLKLLVCHHVLSLRQTLAAISLGFRSLTACWGPQTLVAVSLGFLMSWGLKFLVLGQALSSTFKASKPISSLAYENLCHVVGIWTFSLHFLSFRSIEQIQSL